MISDNGNTLLDSKVFEEDEPWERVWDSENIYVSGFKTEEEYFTGTLRTNGFNAKTYTSEEFVWYKDWSISKNGVDLTANYYVSLDVAVTITPKPLVVYWSSSSAEYSEDFEAPYGKVYLKAGYDSILVPLSYKYYYQNYLLILQ